MVKLPALALVALALLVAEVGPRPPARADEAAPKPAPKPPTPTSPPRPSPAVAPETRANVEATVRNLAGPERNGRGTWDDRKSVAAWIAERFAELHLGPPPGRTSAIYDVGGGPEEPEARHVLAWLPGRTASAGKPGEYLLVGSHYDGVGETKGPLCPGADDNASGVAALLETARLLTLRAKKAPLARSILFVAFDKKNPENEGPIQFAASPPIPLAPCVAMVSLDMLGRSLMDVMPGRLFVMGAEYCAALDEVVGRMGPPAGGVLARPEIDMHIEPSTYGPFSDGNIPFLLVTAGFTIDRFLAGDAPEKLDYDALAARTAWIESLVGEVVSLPVRPAWREKAPPRIEEIRLVREITGILQEELVRREASDVMKGMAALFAKRCDAAIAKGTVTREERDELQRAAIAVVRLILAQSR